VQSLKDEGNKLFAAREFYKAYTQYTNAIRIILENERVRRRGVVARTCERDVY
jgi:hypothetical protein